MNGFLVPATLLLVASFATASEASEDRVQVGHDILVGRGETVTDVVCVGCSIHIEGTANGDLVAVAGHIHVEGKVRGDAVAVGGDVKLGSEAEVGGDIVNSGGRIVRDPGATVRGQIVSPPGIPLAGGGLAGMLLFSFVLSLLLGFILVTLCFFLAGQRRIQTIARTVGERAGPSILTALGAVLGAVILFLIVSLIQPMRFLVAALVGVALAGTLVMGYTGLSSWLGQHLSRTAAPLGAVLIGAALITLLQMIPFLGLLAFVLFFPLSLGSAVLSGYGTSPDWLARQFAPHTLTPPSPRQ